MWGNFSQKNIENDSFFFYFILTISYEPEEICATTRLYMRDGNVEAGCLLCCSLKEEDKKYTFFYKTFLFFFFFYKDPKNRIKNIGGGRKKRRRYTKKMEEIEKATVELDGSSG
jgi:hypothetical protein